MSDLWEKCHTCSGENLCPFASIAVQHRSNDRPSQGLGAPIVGDNKYGGTDLGCGLLLAAVGTEVSHPEGGHRMLFEIEEPCRFRELREREQRLWEEGEGDGVGKEH